MGKTYVCVLLFAAACGARAKANQDGGGAGSNDAFVIGNGQFGDQCDNHFDCASDYCVQPVGDIHGLCSRACNNDCPPGWDCLDVTFAHGHAMVCVPNTARQCLACASDMECPGGACLQIDGSGRCEPTCSIDAQCFTGYTCQPDPAGTHTGKFCQPTTGSCTCNTQNAGAVRTCQNIDAIGTCLGTQTCDAQAGWSTCTAKTAVAEICNGVDDDCDGIVDEDISGLNQPCSNTNGFGSCPGTTACMGAQGVQCAGQIPMMETCNGVDDDCDGKIDEDFAPPNGNLNQSCSAGVGACLKQGAFVCNAQHTGTTCNAVAGTAQPEKCNGLDDDCDGMIDEDFLPPMGNLGTQCSAGLGACQHFGTFACKADGSGTTCNATAGTPGVEVCNYLDDDCDGFVDYTMATMTGFRDPVTGLYSLDVHNCGACGNDCTTQFPFVNASGQCSVVANVAECTMKCAPNTFNLDGFTADGCYFTLDSHGIYVAGDDPTAVDDATCGIGPNGTGAGNHPCVSLAQGLGRAQVLGRTTVYVADATYTESVTLVSGISMLGGFHTTSWIRHLASTDTTIDGFTSMGAHVAAVVAPTITTATTFEGFVVRGPDNTTLGGNSYGIYISNSNALLTIDSNQIFAGRGGAGSTGVAGTSGAPGASALAYSTALYDSYQATGGVCPATSNRGAYGGGVTTCAGTATSGGNGGGNNCTPTQSTQNSTSVAPAVGGAAGGGALGGAGGAAGGRGFDSTLQGNTCLLPSTGGGALLNQYGLDGSGGNAGGAAGGVAGCAVPIGAVSGGHWGASRGGGGAVGGNGGGGGGGGAGGGGICNGCTLVSKDDMLGAHGGGGGAGGCGGGGGGGGESGGGAFAIFVFGGAAPTITSNTIQLGNGGNGGTGGIAGAGGVGGSGTQGGLNTNFFCTGNAGRGGDGGIGGPGSGGGGGCGGPAFGIYTNGVGTPAYCGSNTMSGGTAGTAGAGGTSGGTSGGAGSPGVVLNCEST